MTSKSTQDFVSIKEIRDGVVILKDNSMRLVILTTSVNFALKSEDLQQAIIAQFQNFLNSLDFSVQIFIQSRRFDIEPYLVQLEERHKSQLNELMKIQTREYINFIRDFTENTNIMSKHFFVVIPYAASLLSKGGGSVTDKISSAVPMSFLGKKEDRAGTAKKTEESFLDNKIQLEQRASVVEQGLLRVGLRTARLDTEELIEFYYKMFNPGDLAKPAKVTQ
ncbi:MAG: hypothetical protein A3H57_03890 [Candidatus Taylorbacteria bacterium RIFCSPLOWO2_02_FULL_43_11]|uniref:TraC-like domain-containing protein n=1 Tax=Candidatus Taylorbacteria bacterium RIFCSPHIGHO2_02_FULL_43_32b TaxID=1802306 RepID=A0A1G2MLI0_9BACT|nr:MAG: hypothetical protein A2743_01365 [Candidatus Taylorbacteria bacterium RIFCSPHIGHO2_01_FULL_43_47]OHA24059.1 MAG: hypothetical protein A3C72_02900 [Candidatus Taylorbacteria bacterium RIFCSPHIGHO2_02_FULL_43_32b]OHA31477.1 MAG: hypothetical protein A3B08_00845 [Candidatus Taylorbacteria bacterium RIFCSPLOWO2_01_FULL_43_44]OHA37529.1 MAG: hypothetical protein A3H57_03890 [Candidatus Taylorbacteria bacterium RIFCSPLOWO2_02_FULL_43_11]